MGPPKVNKIGKYEVLDVIGRGGMGMVYKAIDPTIGRMVAIKKVTSVFSDDPDLLKRFYREAQSTGKLQHPNIVTLHDLGDQDGVPYLVMEYLEGDSLEKVIKERRPYTLAEKLNIIIQVCDGLGYAHQRQIIHRDVKPGNVVVLKDGGVKIVDFGIAQLGNERFTRTGQVVGSLYYMSPEQIQDADIDARSDIYSAGVVLYEFLSFVLPFQGKDPTSTLAKILHDSPPSLPDFLRPYPPELDAVVQRALAKDRNERYTSMEDFAFDLQSVQEKLSQDLIAGYLRIAEVCIGTKDWEKAREQLRQVLKFDKQHRRANELLREVQTQIQRQQISEQVGQLRSRADDALAARQWDQALTLLDQAVRLDGANSDLIEFRNSVRRSSALLADALRRAELAHGDGDLETAKRAVEEALNVDPSDTTAKALNAILSKELAERSKRKKIDEFVAEARKEISLRHYTSALDLLQRAEKMDASVAEVHQLMRSATAGREHERRRRALEQACSDIEDLLNRDEYVAACSKADEALQEFPEDLGLLKLRGFAEKQREAWTRRLFIDAQITAARQFVDAGQLLRAQGVLNEALERYSDDSGLISLQAMVTDGITRQEGQRREAERQAAEKRRYINLQVSAAAEMQRSGQTAQALKKLQDALRHYPESEDLRNQIMVVEDLLAREEQQRERAEQEAQRRRVEIEKEVAASRQLMGAKQTGQAVVALEQALRRYPESEDLKSQLEFAQRRLAVEQAERERAEQEARRQRAEIEREIAKAQQLLDSRQASGAVTALEQVLRRYPESEELNSQLEVARQRLVAEQTERERFEQETKQKQVEIEKEVASARQLLDSNQASRALAALEEALRRYPESEKLKAERDFVQGRVAAEQAQRGQAEQEARRRQAWIESEITATRELLDSRQASRAVEALEQGLRQYPDNADLKAQLKFARRRLAVEQAEQERAELEARLKQEEIEREIAAGWQLLDAKQSNQAMLLLEQAVRRFPDSKELRSQLALAQERYAEETAEKQRAEQEEQRKRGEIGKEISVARQLSDSKQSARAVLLLEQALRRYPGNEDLKSQLEVARERLVVEQAERERTEQEDRRKQAERERVEQEARRQQAEVDKEIGASRQLLESGRTGQAAAGLEEAVRRFPQSRELKAQLDLASQRLAREQDERARAEEQAARRSREIDSQIKAGRRWLELNQTSDAVGVLEQAARNFPESGELRSLLATAQLRLKQERAEQEKAAREALARRESIAAAMENANRLLKANQTAKACGVLEEAAERYPESEDLRSQLAGSREKLAREQAEREEAEKRRAVLEAETSRARALLDSGKPEEAVKALEASLRNVGKVPQLQAILETAKAAVEQKKAEERKRAEELRQAGEQKRSRDRDLAELKKLASSVPADAKAAVLERLGRRAQELTRAYASDSEFQENFAIVRKALDTAITGLREREAERDRTRLATKAFAPAGEPTVKTVVIEKPGRAMPEVTRKAEAGSVRSDVRGKWAIAAAVGVVVVGTVVWKVVSSPKTSTEQKTYTVNIESQPAGAKVQVGNQTCVTPNCRLNLPAGNYQLDARLQGYQPTSQALSVDRHQAEPTVRVVMVPEIAPSTSKGSYLVVKTGVDGADVLINGKKFAQPTAGGFLRLPLEPGDYSVEVQKNGYLPVKPGRVRVRKDQETAVSFNLTVSPTMAALAISGARPNVQVLADGHYLGLTAGDGSFSHDLSPGNHEIVLAQDGRNSTAMHSSFLAGKSNSIDGKGFKFPEAPPPPVAVAAVAVLRNLPPGASIKVDGRDTHQADNSGTAQFEVPAGNHTLEITKDGFSEKKIQQSFGAGQTALDGSLERIDLEAPEWAKVESSSEMAALQSFINKFPEGKHAGQAESKLEKLVGDDQNESELESFGKKFSNTRAGDLAGKKAERLRLADQDKRDIQSLMDHYRAAYEQRDRNALIGVYPAMSAGAQKAIQTKFGNAKSVKMDLSVEQPNIEGNQASMKVKQTVTWVQKDGSESTETTPQLTFVLAKKSGRWLIQKGP